MLSSAACLFAVALGVLVRLFVLAGCPFVWQVVSNLRRAEPGPGRSMSRREWGGAGGVVVESWQSPTMRTSEQGLCKQADFCAAQVENFPENGPQVFSIAILTSRASVTCLLWENLLTLRTLSIVFHQIAKPLPQIIDTPEMQFIPLMRIGDEFLKTWGMGWRSWYFFGSTPPPELVLQIRARSDVAPSMVGSVLTSLYFF